MEGLLIPADHGSHNLPSSSHRDYCTDAFQLSHTLMTTPTLQPAQLVVVETIHTTELLQSTGGYTTA